MTPHLVGANATLTIDGFDVEMQVRDFPWPSIRDLRCEFTTEVVSGGAAFNDLMIELLKPAVVTARRKGPKLAKRSPKNHKLFDRWGRLK